MSELRKAKTDYPCFITLTVVGWIDVFTRSIYSEIFLESLDYCRKNKGLKVYAFCIMSSHVHLIVASDNGDLSSVLRDLKSYTAKKIIEAIESNLYESRKEWMLHLFKYFAKYQQQNSTYQFWQKTSYPVELITAKVFDQKMDYIHRNPIESMVVNDEAAFVFTSANPDSTFVVDES